MTKLSSKSIRIAFDASPLLVNKTGVAYYTERLITNMAQRHPDTEFIGFYYNFLGKRSITHFPKAANIRYRPVSFVPSKIIYQLRRWGIQVPVELFIKERVDFILFDNFLGYPSLRKTPSAPVIHDLTYIDLPQYVSAKNGSDLRRFVPQQIKHSSLVVTVSEFSKQRIAEEYHVDPSRIVVTPIPPSEPQLHPPEEARQALATIGVTGKYILFLGTIEPRKNVPKLIDAYLALPADIQKTYKLVIVGRIGWNCEVEIQKFKAAAEQGANILHVGYVEDDIRSMLYQEASLFTSASQYEGFGMPVLEAMNYSKACAISNIPVFKEVAGDAAKYFDQNDPADIARVLAECLQDQTALQNMGIASRQHASKLSWDTVANKLYSAIESVIKPVS